MHSKSILSLQLTIDRQREVINDLTKENDEIKKQLAEVLGTSKKDKSMDIDDSVDL